MDKGNLLLLERLGWLANSQMAKVGYLAIWWLFGVSLFVCHQTEPNNSLFAVDDSN